VTRNIPAESHVFLPVLHKTSAEGLSAHTFYECKIPIPPDCKPPAEPVYRLYSPSETELQALDEYLREMIA
jgi:hypothetical protein